MKYVVGVADHKVSSTGDDLIVTYALGSCLGIVLHDPVAGVGGIHHVMLPTPGTNSDRACENPFMFVDTGTPLFFKEAYAAGAKKERLVVKVCGGASMSGHEETFNIGERNLIMLRKLFWKNGIVMEKQDVGGGQARSVTIEIGTGKTWMHVDGKDVPL